MSNQALLTPEQDALVWSVAAKHYKPNQARFRFILNCRRELKQRTYGLDPATILMLLQILIQLWKWAKDNGYLSVPAVRPVGAPNFVPSHEDFLNLLDEEDV